MSTDEPCSDTMAEIPQPERPTHNEPVSAGVSSDDYVEQKLHAVAQWYAEKTIPLGERQDLDGHNENVVAMATSFFGEKMPPAALAALYLHDVVDRFLNTASPKYCPERARYAQAALLEVLTDPQIDQVTTRYLAHILPDMVHTEVESIKYRQHMADQARRNGGADGSYHQVSTEVVDMISSRYQGDIPSEVWRTIVPLLDFEHIRAFAKDVNIEAMLGKEAELLVNMKVRSSKRRSAWLQDVLEGESFYAPIAEVMGFEGSAMAVRSEAHSTRLVQQGKGAVLMRAKEMVRTIADIGPDVLMQQALGIPQDRCEVSRVVGYNERMKRYPVHIGEFLVQRADGKLATGNWRIKSAGSLAVKLDKLSTRPEQDGATTMDVLGIMVISPNLEASAQDFADYLEQHVLPSHEAGRLQLQAAPSKQRALYIQGSPAYKEAMLAELRRRGISESLVQCDDDTRKTDDQITGKYRVYEVAKATFVLQQVDAAGNRIAVPTEVQFLTKDERRRSRLEAAAHIIYKYISQQEAIRGEQLSDAERRDIVDAAMAVLEDLYDRVGHMVPDSFDVNARSAPRSEAFLQSLGSAALGELPDILLQ